MKRLTLLTTACAIAVLAVLATQLRAQDTNTLDRTYFTFSTAVELPGVTLEPGEYEFRLADNQRQNVVQVIRRGDMKPMGQFTFAEANRERQTDETVVLFREAREGATPAIQYWYFPNEKIGKEFVYPKDQAERIAARTGQTVRSDGGPVTASASASSGSSSAQSQQAAQSPASEDARRNAPVAAQPTAPAGSTAGNRGVTESGSATAGASSAAAANDVNASANAQRNAPASAQPTAAAGSTAGNRGISEPAAPAASASASTSTSASTDVDRGAINRDATADRPIGTSGIAQQSDTNAGAAQNDGQVARNELPRTASPLPFSALLGLLSLAGAAGIRMMRA
jgi:hypothetical protein